MHPCKISRTRGIMCEARALGSDCNGSKLNRRMVQKKLPSCPHSAVHALFLNRLHANRGVHALIAEATNITNMCQFW